ncbi:uncharacterized protein TRUGW13939_01281 [Talaromyces rugulosus]|uniref:NAD(P)-binding protein n=1 Tax=Talaromyces rugulosus TaxID=121627 RepID=A0A7H8QJW8_TALRU|nr:uncharacterized protein TRUGW13939_01281 [Talaromyces rugulosus]QKX54196.1 hypothetical protein TRUGW13939_01281 [Talaromyces rugulosus]
MPFSESDIVDLTGKVVIVTGGNSGLGLQTVKVLASKNARVYLACRSVEKFEQAITEIEDACSSSVVKNISFLQLDLASAATASAAADEFNTKEDKLHILYNNAGVMGTPKGKISDDGYEYQFAVNTFALFVFTYHLLPTLQSTAVSSSPRSVRIINTASSGAKQAGREGIPLDSSPTVGAEYLPSQCYGHSKIGVVLLTRQFAKRYPSILSFAPHPGPVQSNLTRELGIPAWVMAILNKIVFKPVEHGALTQLFAGTSLTLTTKENGAYLVPLAKVEPKLPHQQCYDDVFGEKLWDWCMTAMRKLEDNTR